MGSPGVLGGVSVGTAVMVPGAVGADLASLPGGTRLEIEHPSGALQVEAELDTTVTPPRVVRSGVVRTARKLFDGVVFPRAETVGAGEAGLSVRDKRGFAFPQSPGGIEMRLKAAPWSSAAVAVRP